VASVGRWFSIVRWNDGTSSIVDPPTLDRMVRIAAEQIVGLS
jgi:hypothetical protein